MLRIAEPQEIMLCYMGLRFGEHFISWKFSTVEACSFLIIDIP